MVDSANPNSNDASASDQTSAASPKRRWLSRAVMGALAAFALVEAHAWHYCGRSTENVRALREARIEGPAVTFDDVRSTIAGLPREWRRPHGNSGMKTMVLFTYPSLLAVYNIRVVLDEEGRVATVDRDPEPEPVMAPMLEFQDGKMAEKPLDPTPTVPGPPPAKSDNPGESTNKTEASSKPDSLKPEAPKPDASSNNEGPL